MSLYNLNSYSRSVLPLKVCHVSVLQWQWMQMCNLMTRYHRRLTTGPGCGKQPLTSTQGHVVHKHKVCMEKIDWLHGVKHMITFYLSRQKNRRTCLQTISVDISLPALAHQLHFCCLSSGNRGHTAQDSTAYCLLKCATLDALSVPLRQRFPSQSRGLFIVGTFGTTHYL